MLLFLCVYLINKAFAKCETLEILLFEEPDERLDFKRQSVFIDILIDNFNHKKAHYISAFFALAKSFLAHTYSVTHSSRKHTFVYYEYPLPYYDVTKTIRCKIWETLFASFESYPDEVFDVISAFKPTNHELVPEIMDYDLSLLVPFIIDKFSPNIFKHTYYVQGLIYRYDREEKLINRSYRILSQKFLTDEYKFFCILDWNRVSDKEYFEFDNGEDYDKLKSDEIRRNFVFNYESEFAKLLNLLLNIQFINKKNHFFSLYQSIDIIIEENFFRNPKIGLSLLIAIFQNDLTGPNIYYRSLKAMVNASAEWSLMLWNELENWENGNSLSWRISFFNCIPDEYINSFYCIRLFDTIQSIDRFTFLYIERYSKFNIEDKHITKSILKLVAEKNEQQNFVIAYSDKIFKTNLELFEDDYKLIKISYFQQYKINHSQIFDYKGEGFYNIYRLHPKFLKDFVSQHYCNYSLSQSNKKINLNFLWNSDRNNDRIEESLNIVIENNHYLGIGEHPIKIFFENINVEQQKYAIVFIKDYLVKNSKNARKLNVIFDGIRHYLSPHFEELLLYYLANNPQLEIFQKIDWVGNVGVQVGDVNFGELYIKRWENILVIINKSKDSLAMIPLRAFLKKKIAEYFKRAEHEREMNFLKPDG